MLESVHRASSEAANICWDTVEELRTPNLKATLSYCPNSASHSEIYMYLGYFAEATVPS